VADDAQARKTPTGAMLGALFSLAKMSYDDRG
jgi:hypothetical protein